MNKTTQLRRSEIKVCHSTNKDKDKANTDAHLSCYSRMGGFYFTINTS